MKDRKDIEKRYEQFRCMELPGQPMIAHMGTNYLLNDLHAALIDAEAERGRLREALEFYAERSNYHMIETEFEDIFESDVGVDSGKIACKALGYTWPHGHSSWRHHHDS